MKRTDLLIRIMGLLFLCFLTGCSGQGRLSSAGTSSSPSPTQLARAAALPSLVLNSPGGPWRLAWGDEFNGSAGASPDAAKWAARVGGGGWGNQQLDYDTNNQNAYQDGQGNLVLEARRGNPEGLQCWYGPCQYTSAQITTQGHFSFTYGLLEASIKVPQGQGFWSAFWLIGDNCDTVGWPACGEVDTMEIVGSDPGLIYGTVHGPGYSSGNYRLKQGTFADSFHTFALRWDPDHLYFMVDGITYHTVYRKGTFPDASDWVYNHPFYIVFNLPVGGHWPGSPAATSIFPQRMYISYVRVYTNS